MTVNNYNRYAILRYHEAGLKGKNRSFFINHIVRNVRRVTRNMDVDKVWAERGLIGVQLNENANWDLIYDALRKVFGIVKISLAQRGSHNLEKLKEEILTVTKNKDFDSFRITTKRADKKFPLTSQEVNTKLGKFIQEETGTSVSLKNPDLTIYVDILPRTLYFYSDPLPGAGGLPVGTGGEVGTLLSGGIDSPVAAQRMMKRGCRVVFIHFHAFPLVDGSSRDKAIELVEVLNEYQGQSRLYLVPFAEVQKHIIVSAPPAYRVVLYRRFMVRIAEQIALQEKAQALITGESLGQVASQTLENITVVDSVTEKPIFRPLIGMDKTEIIQQAINIGTYPISILPDQDCCTLFVPKHPVTRSNEAQIKPIEADLDVESLVHLAMNNLEIRDYD